MIGLSCGIIDSSLVRGSMLEAITPQTMPMIAKTAIKTYLSLKMNALYSPPRNLTMAGGFFTSGTALPST